MSRCASVGASNVAKCRSRYLLGPKTIVKKIKNEGFPAFIEALEDNNELFVVYVGPFLSEDDIVNNMEAIQRLSESQNGEISRWKL